MSTLMLAKAHPAAWRRTAPRTFTLPFYLSFAFTLVLACMGQAQSTSIQPLIAANSSQAFIDSIGVNVHFNYYGSVYTNQTSALLSRIQQLGITHFRDALCWEGSAPNTAFYSLHRQLGSLGYTTDYVASINQPASQFATYPSLVNDIEAVEPANEYDNSGDPSWAANITAQQAQLYSTMHAVAPQVTVLAPSLAFPIHAPLLGNLQPIANAANLHGYFGGANPATTSTLIADSQQNVPGHAVWVTETGYFAHPGPAFGTYGVTPAVQAIYSPRLLLDYWNSGATRTYLYELADDQEPGENAAYYNWGLLDSNANPKPAFNALANLTHLLADPHPASGQAFTPAALALTINASSASVRYSLFQKRDGSYYLALWNEVASYDPVSGQQLTPAPASVTLHIGRTVLYNGTQQFDATGNYTTSVMPPAQILTLAVTDKLQILTWILR